MSRVDRRINWGAIRAFGKGIGRGPVYPGLGERALVFATPSQYGGGWYAEKVFWYIRPSYRGPVLVRGRRLDGAESVGFNGRAEPDDELRIAPGETVRWDGKPKGSRGVPSAVRLQAKGCYGFQVDGNGFSNVVIFRGDISS